MYCVTVKPLTSIVRNGVYSRRAVFFFLVFKMKCDLYIRSQCCSLDRVAPIGPGFVVSLRVFSFFFFFVWVFLYMFVFSSLSLFFFFFHFLKFQLEVRHRKMFLKWEIVAGRVPSGWRLAAVSGSLHLTLLTHVVGGEDLLYTLPSGLWRVLPHMGPSIRVNVTKSKRKENTKLPTTCTSSVSNNWKI